jgi:hypothetical protein
MSCLPSTIMRSWAHACWPASQNIPDSHQKICSHTSMTPDAPQGCSKVRITDLEQRNAIRTADSIAVQQALAQERPRAREIVAFLTVIAARLGGS